MDVSRFKKPCSLFHASPSQPSRYISRAMLCRDGSSLAFHQIPQHGRCDITHGCTVASAAEGCLGQVDFSEIHRPVLSDSAGRLRRSKTYMTILHDISLGCSQRMPCSPRTTRASVFLGTSGGIIPLCPLRPSPTPNFRVGHGLVGEKVAFCNFS